MRKPQIRALGSGVDYNDARPADHTRVRLSSVAIGLHRFVGPFAMYLAGFQHQAKAFSGR